MECKCLTCNREFDAEPNLADEELGLQCPYCESALVEFRVRQEA